MYFNINTIDEQLRPKILRRFELIQLENQKSIYKETPIEFLKHSD